MIRALYTDYFGTQSQGITCEITYQNRIIKTTFPSKSSVLVKPEKPIKSRDEKKLNFYEKVNL